MRRLVMVLAMVAMLCPVRPAAADADNPAQLAQATIDKALGYLKSRQKPDFGWQDEADPPAFTALVLRAFISDEQYDAGRPFLEKGYGKLLSYQVNEGGIYKDTLACYNTAIAISTGGIQARKISSRYAQGIGLPPNLAMVGYNLRRAGAIAGQERSGREIRRVWIRQRLASGFE